MTFADNPIVQKLQLRFSKTGAARFLSHHDLMRLFARAARRAALPVRMTQGHDPRPRLVFATALELGVDSLAEECEVEMARWIALQEARARLAQQLPAGIALSEVRLLPPRRDGEHPVEMLYRVRPPGGAASLGMTPETASALLARQTLPFDRPREQHLQHLDLRPSLVSISLDGDDLLIALSPTATGAARPAEIASLLAGRPLTETRKWQTTKLSMRMSR